MEQSEAPGGTCANPIVASHLRPSRSSMVWRRALYVILAILIVAGLVYRFAYIAPQARVFGDGYWRYVPMARNLLAGHGFSIQREPPYTADRFEVPGYPLFLAGIYGLTGGSQIAVAVVQLLLEIATVLLIAGAALAARLPRSAAGAAAVLAWLCPSLSSWSMESYADVPSTFLVALLLLLTLRLWTAPQLAPFRSYLVLGLIAGITALVRADTYPVIAVVGLALAMAPAKWPGHRRVLGAGVYTLAAVLVMTPWIFRDFRVLGHLQPPGWKQFTQVGDPYLQWCNTWVDDPEYVLPYMLHRGYHDSIRAFPADRIPDATERATAEKAYAEWISTGYEGRPKEIFRQLVSEVRQKRSLTSRLVVPLKRTLSIWLKFPSAAQMPGGSLGKAYKYGLWIAILLAAGVGLMAGIVRRQPVLLLPVGVIVARLLLPLASAAGAEIRYQFPALPAVLLLAAFGIAWMMELLRGRVAARLAAA